MQQGARPLDVLEESKAEARAFGGPLDDPRNVGDDELAAALARTGMHHVELDQDGQAVRYRIEGLRINLGSIPSPQWRWRTSLGNTFAG